MSNAAITEPDLANEINDNSAISYINGANSASANYANPSITASQPLNAVLERELGTVIEDAIHQQEDKSRPWLRMAALGTAALLATAGAAYYISENATEIANLARGAYELIASTTNGEKAFLAMGGLLSLLKKKKRKF